MLLKHGKRSILSQGEGIDEMMVPDEKGTILS
jgi:hypothetical protein